MKRLLILAVLACLTLPAQTMDEPVVLTVDVDNAVLYGAGDFDVSKLGKDPGPTNACAQVPFVDGINIGDCRQKWETRKGNLVVELYAHHTVSQRSAAGTVYSGLRFIGHFLLHVADLHLRRDLPGTIRDSAAGQGQPLEPGRDGQCFGVEIAVDNLGILHFLTHFGCGVADRNFDGNCATRSLDLGNLMCLESTRGERFSAGLA